MEETCLICAEDFSSKRAPITCEYCSFSACSTCCQRYILDQEKSLCMSPACQKEWTRKFIVNTFNNNWVSNKWKDMNAKVGVDKERALFPATMTIIAERAAKDAIKAEIEAVKILEDNLRRRRAVMEQRLRTGRDIAEKTVSNGRKCPDENCRGYLSTQWKCGVCEKWACHECHVIKGDTRDTEHTCDPDTLATAKLLDKDTKPCPKCSTPIHKIAGCDQMWCTQCHTGFSWKRGTIENRVHNPHYYEWQRQNGGGRAPRNVGDFECGRDIGDGITVSLLNRTLRRIPDELLDKDIKNAIPKYIRNTIHLHEVNGPRFRQANEDVNTEARVKYITKVYDEKKFASMVHKNNKATAKKQDIFDVIQLQHQGVTDIVYRIVELLQPLNTAMGVAPKITASQVRTMCENIKSTFAEFQTLTDYSNGLLLEHCKTYQCKLWRLDINADQQYYTLT